MIRMLPDSFFLIKKGLACSIHSLGSSQLRLTGKIEFLDPSGPLNTHVWLLSFDGEIKHPAVL